jgi:pyruvate formate lyase activating enzyme
VVITNDSNNAGVDCLRLAQQPAVEQPRHPLVTRLTTASTIAHGVSGFVHSYESGSAVDGPGLRLVIWTTGCLFRCGYCHNPDTWKVSNGRQMSVEEVMREVSKYARFLKRTNGGVTISGGEPLVQAPFVCRIFRACKELGLHTTLDTNGYLGERLTDADLASIDLVLLDIKSWDPATHKHVTGREVEPVLCFARRLADLGKPVWIRFVLVPGLTDDPANVDGLAAFVATLPNVERVEILPFHQMGRHKWEEAGMEYQLRDTDPPGPELITRVTEQFRRCGLPVR